MKKSLFVKIAIFVVFVAAVFSLPAAPTASSVVAQEPTPTTEVSGQIVGGAPATPGEWPWQVALIDGSATDLYADQFCGGSLVSAKWVVTAAHCVVDNDGNPIAASAVDIVAGIYDLSNPADGYQRRDVSQIIVHSNYDNDTLDSDIALLELAASVTLGGSGETRTAAVPLVSASVGSLAGVNSWVTGWGNTESVPLYPDELYEVQVPIITNDLCNQSYSGAVTSNMLCAGYAEGGKDACYGDSGGPLVAVINGQWQLAGIVSTGIGCANPDYYGVYTRVSNFTSWLETYVTADLKVNSIDIYPPDEDLDPNIYVNDDVFLYIDVQNIAGVSSAPFTVNIYVDDTYTACSTADRDYYFDSAGLAGGDSEFLQLTIPAGTLASGQHSVTVYADSGCGITEDNESDNVLTVQFDVNDVAVAAPDHDDVTDTPRAINSLPYTDTVDVRGATRDPSDPTDIACPAPDHILDAGLASVWYEYTPAEDVTVTLDTLNSNYDTYVAVWEGIPGTTLIGCNDDYAPGNLQSSLSITLTGGTTYLFEIAQYSNDITNVTAASLDGKSSPDVEAQAGGGLSFRVVQGSKNNQAIDFNGDNKSEIGVFRLSNGEWIVKNWENDTLVFRKQWGNPSTDIPVLGDFNGDGKTDLAVFRTTNGEWIVKNWETDALIFRMQWGNPATDIPVLGDYNGDGKADLAVFRTTTGEWIVKDWETDTLIFRKQWGNPATDKPVPGDYNGDGKLDLAVFRTTTGEWIVKDWETDTLIFRMQWGNPATDIPVQADFNGDGKTDLAVFRKTNGEWIVKDWEADALLFRMQWGAPSTDQPIYIYR